MLPTALSGCTYNSEGAKSYDPKEWEFSLRAYYYDLFSSQVESQGEKKERLHALESFCFNSHLDGTHSWVHLPLHTLLDSRMRVQKCKAPGMDKVVYDMFLLFELDTLETLRAAFEKRMYCVTGHTNGIPDWLNVLVHTIPKDKNVHSPDRLRPLSLLCALIKWYMSCLTAVCSQYVCDFDCDLYGFRPGHQ